MSKAPKRNKYLPVGWQVLVNESFVNELDWQAARLADFLEHEYKERLALYSRDLTVAIFVVEIPRADVMARAIEIMHNRGYTVTGADSAHPQACSITLTVAPRARDFSAA